MFILFLFLLLVFSSHNSQAFRGLYRFVKAPSLALGVGCSVCYYSFLKNMQSDYVAKLEEVSQLQVLQDPSRHLINPHVRAEIEQLCKEGGITLQFLVYDATLPPFSALSVSIDKGQGGIILGPGFGLGKDEKPCANPTLLEFLIGHELMHIIQNDIEKSRRVVSASPLVTATLWRLSTFGGRGKLFGLMGSSVGCLINVGRLVSCRTAYEYHADKRASQVPEVLMAGADYFDTVVAQQRKDAEHLIMRVVAGQGSELDQQSFESVLQFLVRAYMTHPLAEERAKRLRTLADKYRNQKESVKNR